MYAAPLHVHSVFTDSSVELKTLLENPHLQTLLRDVDASRDVERDVSAAMREPLFLEFADVCLKVIEPERFSEQQRDT